VLDPPGDHGASGGDLPRPFRAGRLAVVEPGLPAGVEPGTRQRLDPFAIRVGLHKVSVSNPRCWGKSGASVLGAHVPLDRVRQSQPRALRRRSESGGPPQGGGVPVAGAGHTGWT